MLCMKEEIIYIQHMDSPRDIMRVSQELERLGVRVKGVELGTAAFINSTDVELEQVEKALQDVGYRVLQKNEKEFADNVKLFSGIYLERLCACVEMPLLSYFLEKQVGLAYSTISKRFRKIEGWTIEKYFTRLKIEKVKSLLQSTDMSIKDVALLMKYRSPGSLAKKFREVTGFSLYDFKNKNVFLYRMASGY